MRWTSVATERVVIAWIKQTRGAAAVEPVFSTEVSLGQPMNQSRA